MASNCQRSAASHWASQESQDRSPSQWVTRSRLSGIGVWLIGYHSTCQPWKQKQPNPDAILIWISFILVYSAIVYGQDNGHFFLRPASVVGLSPIRALWITVSLWFMNISFVADSSHGFEIWLLHWKRITVFLSKLSFPKVPFKTPKIAFRNDNKRREIKFQNWKRC